MAQHQPLKVAGAGHKNPHSKFDLARYQQSNPTGAFIVGFITVFNNSPSENLNPTGQYDTNTTPRRVTLPYASRLAAVA